MTWHTAYTHLSYLFPIKCHGLIDGHGWMDEYLRGSLGLIIKVNFIAIRLCIHPEKYTTYKILRCILNERIMYMHYT